METLGLSSTPQPEDNMFKRLFWPTIHNQYEVDLLGRQGFWIAAGVGLISGIGLIATGHPLVGIATFLVFALGAVGIRERSLPAAILVFLLYLLNFIANTWMTFRAGGFTNPLLPLVFTMLLYANVRGAFQSKRWMDGEDTELPERSQDGILDTIANVVPAKIWPNGKFAFFVLAPVLLLLTMLGTVAVMVLPAKPAPQQQPGMSVELPATER